MIRMTRPLAALSVSAALLAALTGCSPSACTAIGYLYSVEVQTTGEFASLEVCADGDCLSSADAGAEPTAEPTPTPGQAGERSPLFNVELPPFSLVERSDGGWTVGSLSSPAEHLTVRAHDADGAVLAERDFELEWTRTGGSEQCGGPMRTPPVEFAV
jgi:hypothetical protein